MMWDDELITTYEQLLERVDEYTLYCFYLGFAPELDRQYCSPIRETDIHPSWSLYVSKYRKNREFMWKDKGGKGASGDIFRLVSTLFGYTTSWQVLVRIKGDFDLGPSIAGERRIIPSATPPAIPSGVDIRVKSRALDQFDTKWWKRWNVDRKILDRYQVNPIRYYFTHVDQEVASIPKDPAYSYLVMGRYKLYFPFERKQFRFRSELSERELEGFEQLDYSTSLLIITKSMKDVMCLRSFGYEAVSPRGESILISELFMGHFQDRYPHRLLLFDNDGKHKAESYKEPKIWVPLSSGKKDISDFNDKYGDRETATLLKQLVHEHYPAYTA